MSHHKVLGGSGDLVSKVIRTLFGVISNYKYSYLIYNLVTLSHDPLSRSAACWLHDKLQHGSTLVARSQPILGSFAFARVKNNMCVYVYIYIIIYAYSCVHVYIYL